MVQYETRTPGDLERSVTNHIVNVKTGSKATVPCKHKTTWETLWREKDCRWVFVRLQRTTPRRTRYPLNNRQPCRGQLPFTFFGSRSALNIEMTITMRTTSQDKTRWSVSFGADFLPFLWHFQTQPTRMRPSWPAARHTETSAWLVHSEKGKVRRALKITSKLAKRTITVCAAKACADASTTAPMRTFTKIPMALRTLPCLYPTYAINCLGKVPEPASLTPSPNPSGRRDTQTNGKGLSR